jgi:rubredoxin
MTTYKRKKWLISTGQKTHKCEECDLILWNNKPIPIELHHIDGDSSNNEISNLKILCPNCHAQTENYKSKNKKIGNHGSNITDEQLIESINSSFFLTEVLKSFDIKRSPSIRNRCNSLISNGKCSLKVRGPKPTIIKEKKSPKKYHCPDCGCEKTKSSNRCNNCRYIHTQSLKKPEESILVREIKDMGYWKVGIKYDVSDNAVRKWIKSYGLDPKVIKYIPKGGGAEVANKS